MLDMNGCNMFNDAIGPKIKLFIFTPRHHNVSVIRPYVFNFTEDMADTFLQGNGTTDAMMRMNGFNNNSLCDAIMPSTNGIVLNTNVLDQYYSFVLIIDGAEPVRSMISFGAPKRRTVLTGYFYDEPILQHTCI